MTLMLTLDDKLEQQLKREASRQGLSVTEYTTKIIAQHMEATRRASATISLLESWLSEDADEQRETGAFLIQAMDSETLRQEQSDLLDSIAQHRYTPPAGIESLAMLREDRAR